MSQTKHAVSRALHRVYGPPAAARRQDDARAEEGRLATRALVRRVCDRYQFDDLTEGLSLGDDDASSADTVVLDSPPEPKARPAASGKVERFNRVMDAAPNSARRAATTKPIGQSPEVEVDESEIETVVVDGPLARRSAGDAPLRAGWQLPRFTWPDQAMRMIETLGVGFDQLADRIDQAAVASGAVALVGASSGAGATIMTIAAAKVLSDRGEKCSLVDAHFVSPDLAFRLGVSAKCGWESAWSEPSRLAAFTIAESERDSLLLPLTKSIPQAESRLESLAEIIGEITARIRGAERRVLIDAGVCPADQSACAAWLRRRPWLGGVVLVDRQGSTPGARAAMRDACQAIGTPFVGVIENFSPATAAAPRGSAD